MHIGESFLEASFDGIEKRLYFPKLGLKNSIRECLQPLQGKSPQGLVVSLGYLEKIFQARLGASVAQVVTKGFEDLLSLQDAPHLKGQRIGNADLIFPIQERTLASGEIRFSPHKKELEAIHLKLEMMEVKKVAIHLLHAGHHPGNQNQIREFFEAKGYDVFIPSSNSKATEFQRWRRNLLNASFKGIVEELRKEVSEAVIESGYPEDFPQLLLGPHGGLSKKSNFEVMESLFGSQHNLRNEYRPHSPAPFLYLGLEKFFLISQEADGPALWKSPWGDVELSPPNIHTLTFNCASLIHVDSFGELSVLPKLGHFDPGPLCFGRGLNMTVLDLWMQDILRSNLEGLRDIIRPQAESKILNTLVVLAKMSQLSNLNPSELVESLKCRVALQIWIQIAPFYRTDIQFGGPLGPYIEPYLKQIAKKWSHVPSDFWESRICCIKTPKET